MQSIPGRVMVFGTFDLFHPGHVSFIEQAMDEGDEVIVVVARDQNVLRFKEAPKHDEQTRLERVRNAFPGLKVVLGNKHSHLGMIRRYRPELICLGYDQIGFLDILKKEMPQLKTKRMQAYQPEKYKSSLIGG